MIIVGIDPGVQHIGIAVYDTNLDVFLQLEEYNITKKNNYVSFVNYLYTILSTLTDLKEPIEISIEKPFFTPLTIANNIRTLEVIGLIKYTAERLNIDHFQYAPTTIKKEVTGNGRASKEDIINYIEKTYRFQVESNHVADASAIALCHHRQKS